MTAEEFVHVFRHNLATDFRDTIYSLLPLERMVRWRLLVLPKDLTC
jgi:hypothetical protein